MDCFHTIVADMLSNWEAWESIALPNWDLMDPQVRSEAILYLEQIDVDAAVIAVKR
jgi:hypothetical protein